MGFDADQGLRLGGVEMRKRFAERGSQRRGRDLLRRGAQHGFGEAICVVRGALERG